jgi:hypothetical protein
MICGMTRVWTQSYCRYHPRHHPATTRPRYRGLSLRVRSVFGSQKIVEFDAEATSRLNFAKAVVAIDPSGDLAKFNQPISEINRIGLLESRRRAQIEQHKLRSVAPNIDDLDANAKSIDASLEALNWTKQLLGLAPRPTVRKLLLSSDALKIRERILAFNSVVETDLAHLDSLIVLALDRP